MNQKSKCVILLLLGILLLIIAMPTGGKKEEGTNTGNVKIEETEIQTKDLEKRLEQFLSKVEGVGKSSVMITYKSTTEKIVEKDIGQHEDSKEEETIYENGEDGEQQPYVKKENMAEIEGVVVIAEGGNQPVVVKHITEAVQALFDVDTHKIKIMKGG